MNWLVVWLKCALPTNLNRYLKWNRISSRKQYINLRMNQYWEVEIAPTCFRDFRIGTQCVNGIEPSIQRITKNARVALCSLFVLA